MSEDLIRRSDVIKALKDNMVEMGGEDFSEIGVHSDDIDAIINDIPTIEPKRGEWINQHEDGHGSWVGTCNQCDKENHVDNFCPNCGADMRKGADDE